MPKVSDYLELLSLLERLFCLIPRGSRHILMGDFNIDALGVSSVSDAYRDLLCSYAYFVANDKVTRPMSRTVIDHFVVNFDDGTVYTINNDLSDHNGILLALPENLVEEEDSTELKRSFIDLYKLREELRHEFTDLSVFDEDDADQSVERVVKVLTDAVRHNSREVKVMKLKHDSKPWINAAFLRLVAQKKN